MEELWLIDQELRKAIIEESDNSHKTSTDQQIIDEFRKLLTNTYHRKLLKKEKVDDGLAWELVLNSGCGVHL